MKHYTDHGARLAAKRIHERRLERIEQLGMRFAWAVIALSATLLLAIQVWGRVKG